MWRSPLFLIPGENDSVEKIRALAAGENEVQRTLRRRGGMNFPLCLAPLWPAQDGLEPVEAREILKLPVQRGVFLLQ